METYFSMISYILASGNGFSGQWKLISFAKRFFLLVEAVTEIRESQFLRRDHILTDVIDFLASGNQLLPLSRTEVTCCQWKQFLLLQLLHSFCIVKTKFSSTGKMFVLIEVVMIDLAIVIRNFLMIQSGLFVDSILVFTVLHWQQNTFKMTRSFEDSFAVMLSPKIYILRSASLTLTAWN